MSQKQTPNPDKLTWGLGVPGRPATPSEGYAQAYHRVGPAATQETRKFDNGTCLTFGPDDPVDEFEAEHPFANQLALVDKAIRDIRVTRQRYEGVQARMPANSKGEDQDSVNSGETALPDPFDNFRTQTLDSANLLQVTLDSGTYKQVPSRFASCGTLVSIYSHPNKSDVPGAAHPGNSVDTRFGNGAKTGFGTLQQHINREDEKRRLRGRIRPGRQAWLENNEQKESLVRGLQRGAQRHQTANVNQQTEQGIDENGQSLSGESVPTTRSSSAQPALGQNTEIRGFPTPSDRVPSYPLNIKVKLHPGQEWANKLYNEQLHALQNRQAENDIAQSTTRGVTLSAAQNFGLHGPLVQNPLPGLVYGGQMLGAQGIVFPVPSPSPLQSSMTLQEITNLQTRFASHNLGGQDEAQGMSNGGISEDPKKRIRRRRVRGMAQQADIEYGRYMDELNEESRRQGNKILAGDIMSGHAQAQVRFNIQPPSPLPNSDRMHAEDSEAEYDDEYEDEEVEAEEQNAWSNLMTNRFRLQAPAHHLNPAVFDPATSSFVPATTAFATPVQPSQHLLGATRPPTESPNLTIPETGRQSEPPRARPALLSPIDFQGRDSSLAPLDIHAIRQRALKSPVMFTGTQDNRIFGELPGNISRDPSPGAGRRRWFEQK